MYCTPLTFTVLLSLVTPLSIPIGGRQSKYAVNAFEVFDTDTRSWTKFPNIPNKRAYSRHVISEGSLYSLGGLRQGGTYRRPKFTKTVDIFDMEQGKFNHRYQSDIHIY